MTPVFSLDANVILDNAKNGIASCGFGKSEKTTKGALHRCRDLRK